MRAENHRRQLGDIYTKPLSKILCDFTALELSSQQRASAQGSCKTIDITEPWTYILQP